MNGRELRDALRRMGFEQVRQGMKHEVWRHEPTGVVQVVSRGRTFTDRRGWQRQVARWRRAGVPC
jgi:predicted RNA binding protein YcfA (HicA-like mRNA interferase family)